MKSQISIAVRLTCMSFALFGVLYPLTIAAFARFAPGGGRGLVSSSHGGPGQAFVQDRYFQSRPSAVDYNAAGSCGSNKGPSNPEYLMGVEARIDTFLAHNPGITRKEIPADLVTCSGSGLDPHISVQAAYVQVKRVAKARNIQESALKSTIDACIERPLWGFLGPEKINVLYLNRTLDGK